METLWQDIWKSVQADFSDLPDVAALTQLVLRLLLTTLLGGLLGYQREHQGLAGAFEQKRAVSSCKKT